MSVPNKFRQIDIGTSILFCNTNSQQTFSNNMYLLETYNIHYLAAGFKLKRDQNN